MMEQFHMLRLGLAILFYAAYCTRPYMAQDLAIESDGSANNKSSNANGTEENFVYYQGVQGKPGIDFPVLSHIPKTSFTCNGLETGYYADLETNCQVFHICEEGKKISFLCPNGTIFQQSDLICEWWFKVNCSNSPFLYEESAEQLRDENIKRKASRRVVNNQNNYGAVMRMEEASSISISRNGKVAKKKLAEESKAKLNNPSTFKDHTLKPNIFSISTDGTTESHNKHISHQTYKSSTPESSKHVNHQTYKTSTPKYNEHISHQIHQTHKTSTPKSSKKQNQRNNHIVNPLQNQNLNQQSFNAPNYNQQQSFNHHDIQGNKNQYQRISSSTTQFEATTKSLPKENKKPNSKSNKKIRLTLSSQLGGTASRNSNAQATVNFNNLQNHKINDTSEYVNIRVATNPTFINLNHKNVSGVNKKDIDSAHKYSNNLGKYQVAESNGKNKNYNNLALERNDDEETQIPQESASIFGSGKNSLYHNRQSFNQYPNHRDTYSEVKDPSYYNEKYFSKLTSVTPQYLTTQSFNNGKPFIGTMVGVNIPKSVEIKNDTLYTTKNNERSYFNNAVTSTPIFKTFYNNNGYEIPKFEQLALAPDVPMTNLPIPGNGSFNIGLGTIIVPDITTEPSTTKKIDHATVYGRYTNTRKTTPLPKSTTTTTTSSENLITSNSRYFDNLAREVTTEQSTSYDPLVYYSTASRSTSSYDNLNIQTTINPTITTIDPYKIYKKKTSSPYLRPRPFERANTYSNEVIEEATYKPLDDSFYTGVPYAFFKVSTAGPFRLPTQILTTAPTQPTISNDIYGNAENMINALMEITGKVQSDNLSETPRPGLIVPPSAGPQTLHTLATYFATALDGIKNKSVSDDIINSISDTEMEDKLTALFTNMTQNQYNDLFKVAATTIATTTEDLNDLEGQHSKNPVQSPPPVRQLAKVFTQALSAYLDDPENFKRILEQVRPTEPSNLPDVTGNYDDELLNFSDDDIKPSVPPVYPSQTWSYKFPIPTTEKSIEDGSNSINQESENLFSADSQSFVSQFNNLTEDEKQDTFKNSLPNNHWTSSHDATKLWQTTFAVNPAVFNEHLHTTQALTTPETITEDSGEINIEESSSTILPQREIKYELRSLPKFDLNTTQVRGILIDFMNTSKIDDTNRLQRILRKLNTTEGEFLEKMREIDENPLTRRLILLLINECNGTSHQVENQALNTLIKISEPVQTLSIDKEVKAIPSDSESVNPTLSSNNFRNLVDSKLEDNDHDARALQLLNSLYTIASKFGR